MACARTGKLASTVPSSPVGPRSTRRLRKTRKSRSTGKPATASGTQVDADTGEEGSNELIVKGYELEEGQYVEVSSAKLRASSHRGVD
jgi:hypothetical protein